LLDSLLQEIGKGNQVEDCPVQLSSQTKLFEIQLFCPKLREVQNIH